MCATYLYLFRTVRREGPGYIEMYHFTWGSVRKISVDINKDGLVDFEATYAGWATDRSADDAIASAVASSNCDGVLDVKIEYFEDGRRRSVIFDADGDDIAEVRDPVEGFRRMARRCKEWRRWVPDSSDLGTP